MDSQPSQVQSGRSPVDTLARTSSSSSTLIKTNSDASIQSLSSILNNPLGGKSGVYGSDSSWVGWWSSSSAVALPEFTPLASTKANSDVTRFDFQNYLAPIAEPYSRFEDVRKHSSKENVDLESMCGAGEALVACLREVPALYFKEDFELEDGATFRAACPFTNVSDNLVLQEKLSHYLDVVELHLVKEISLRSNSFFEAQGQLQDLNVKIVEGCSRIRELKETIRLLDTDLVDSAVQIQELNATRSNLKALLQKLRLILYVNQALSTLKLLVASADCAGALDVTNDLQQLVEGDELTGLHCFRHLREHVAASIESINSILSAEFIHSSMQDVGDTDAVILSKVKARASLPANGTDNDVKLEEDEASNFRDRLLPTIIGLLRTAKLPSVLRIYRDTLTADMKTAIKTTVAELLPVLSIRLQDHDLSTGDRVLDADGGGASLASKLRNLSSDCFVELLGAIFMVVEAHLVRAAEVKKVIEWILSNLDGHYAADSVAAAIAHGATVADISHESDLSGNSVLPYSAQTKFPSFPAREQDASVPAKMSRNFRADVLRENTEAVFAACDAAQGRWAKLLGVRALLHPKLRLQEFLSVYNITQEFITASEKIGGRLGFSIRGTLQSQAKAFIDCQHESRMAKIKAVLDQETWVEVDVPDEFQAIVNSLCSEHSTSEDNDVPAMSYTKVVVGNDVSVMADSGVPLSEQQIHHNAFSETSSEHDVSSRSVQTTDATKRDRPEITLAQGNYSDVRERKKTSSQTLFYRGVGYHMVNCGLILLKMLSEYIEMNNFLPALSPEVVHRLVEILKFFNTRTCQLVLGAGAMQVSGLKSITSKHLALASQVINFTLSIIPDIRQNLFLKVPESRKSLLLSEIDRVAMDYKVHMDEIHSKLVQIMRERLLVHLRGLPQIVETWNRPEDAEPQPSQFARSLTKEVGFLQRVLSRTLNESDVQAIFRQVVIIFHSQISEAFSRLEISTPQAKDRLYRDIKLILGCIRTLPSDNVSGSDTPNWGQLDELLLQRFGTDLVGFLVALYTSIPSTDQD